ncbi:MAG: pectin acetylesterase-family hydrolase [Ilumatobacter sp.]|uniref:pectin acetylesterase-family hydrolase n=1 Tax=Ilumatobacter sp. TaxID=1967498 RepID=UPI0032995FCD
MNRVAAALATVALLAAGCAGITDDSAPGPSAPEVPDGAASWHRIVPDSPDCMCGDGSAYSFFERPGDPSKVLLFFEGGGACYSAETCDSNGDPTYSVGIRKGVDELAAGAGLFDAANDANPLADHSIIYVPYCTGDGHLGNIRTEYSPGVVVEHRGWANTDAVLDHLVEVYPAVAQVVVAGESAGSVATPLVAGVMSDRLPAAEIVTFGDGSGAYPDLPVINESIVTLWGADAAIPDWPEAEGQTGWSVPGLTVRAGLRDPDITFARFDFAFDGIQADLVGPLGLVPDQIPGLLDATELQIETSGIPLAVYVAPGNSHTIIGNDDVYDVEVEGVRLIDWITELVDGDVPPDVHCVDCEL